MLKGGVIMDVVNPEQARIAEEACVADVQRAAQQAKIHFHKETFLL